jgi:hypothetical protein
MKILFAIHIKHPSFWPLADHKPIKNDLVNAMPWQSMLAIYMCLYYIINVVNTFILTLHMWASMLRVMELKNLHYLGCFVLCLQILG